MKKSVLAALCMLCSVICFADDSAGQARLVKNAIANKAFDIRVDRIYPQSGPPIDSDCTNHLKIGKGQATSELPFFGEAYTAVIAGVDEMGIRFYDQPVSSFRIEKKSKKRETKYEINFFVDTGSERFDFFVEIWDEGQASIRVTSMNRSSMSYSGELVFEEQAVAE